MDEDVKMLLTDILEETQKGNELNEMVIDLLLKHDPNAMLNRESEDRKLSNIKSKYSVKYNARHQTKK